ncbi:MAG: geranylgeranyl reductase, partial [Promethearchaeota archaeon CR_4]
MVGAGTGGTTAARFAGRAGLKVCLLDTKPREKVGEKVCGDAVGGEIFDILGIDPPRKEDLAWKVKGAKLVSPDRQTSIMMVDPSQAGYIVNRREFGQRLLDEALGAGSVEFRERTFAKELIVEGGAVKGVKVRDKTKSGTEEIRAKVTIDATGYHTPLRKCLDSPFIERDIDEERDSIICYREIVDLGTAGDFDPDYIVITLDQKLAPGGYLWHFPKNKTSLNIGIGTYLKFTREIKKLYFQNAFQPYVNAKKYTVTARGGGLVTVRRPIDSAVEDGVMFVGDAAAQVNPL